MGKKIEETVVDTYQKIEDSVVGVYKNIEEKFVDKFLAKDNETNEEAKARIKKEQQELHQKNQDILKKNINNSLLSQRKED